jgi:hypothetical protein
MYLKISKSHKSVTGRYHTVQYLFVYAVKFSSRRKLSQSKIIGNEKEVNKLVKHRKGTTNQRPKVMVLTSVAYPGCLSRIPDPDFYPSRIPDLGSRIQKQQQKRRVKKCLLS